MRAMLSGCMFKLLLVVVLWLRSASDERVHTSSDLHVLLPSLGPTMCLPLDDYIRLRDAAAASKSREREMVSEAITHRRGVKPCILLFRLSLGVQTDSPSASVSSTQLGIHNVDSQRNRFLNDTPPS